MTDEKQQLIADIRLSAVETLLQQLFAHVLANEQEQESDRIKRELSHSERLWMLHPGDPPAAVDELEARTELIQQVIDRHIAEIARRERYLRRDPGAA